MAGPLTDDAVSLLSKAFESSPKTYDAVLDKAQASPYLAGLINAFVSKGGNSIVVARKSGSE